MTRQRLYLDAQEQILSSVSKVVVDQKGGNSLLYLPLDKLLSVTGATTPQAQVNAPISNQTATQNELEAQRTRDAFRSRERETR